MLVARQCLEGLVVARTEAAREAGGLEEDLVLEALAVVAGRLA